MGLKKLLLMIPLAMVAAMGRADDTEKATADSIADRPLKKVGTTIKHTIRELDRLEDTYIEPQHYEWSVMLQATRNFDEFILSSNGQSIMFSPDQRVKVGPYFGWRWIFLGWTFDLKDLQLFKSSSNGKRGFDLSIYSSQVGVDLFYRHTGGNYKLRQVRMGYGIDGTHFEDVPFGGIQVDLTGVNAYYIFNHGRFSYPAAFSQSTCQKVSCGSWMAGAGFYKNELTMDFEQLRNLLEDRLGAEMAVKLDSGMMFDRVKYYDYSLSAGYAYNWVFAPKWLFCASGLAALAYKTGHGDTADEYDGFSMKKVNVDGIGRFALVYNNTRWYAGATAILRTNNYHNSRFTANNIFGSLNAFVGYNFGLKKKYRQKSGKKEE